MDKSAHRLQCAGYRDFDERAGGCFRADRGWAAGGLHRRTLRGAGRAADQRIHPRACTGAVLALLAAGEGGAGGDRLKLNGQFESKAGKVLCLGLIRLTVENPDTAARL